MNWDAIGAIGELFGGIIVVASVVYLAAQIRLHIKTSQDEAYREVFSQLREQLHSLRWKRTSVLPLATSAL